MTSSSPLADELLKEFRQQREAGNGSSGSASISSFLGGKDAMDGTQSHKSSSSSYLSNRRKTKWQSSSSSAASPPISEWDRSHKSQKSLARMEVGLNLQEVHIPGMISSPLSNTDENNSMAASSHASSSLSTLSSASGRLGKTLVARDMNVPSSYGGASVSSTRTTEDDLDDLERKIRKMREMFARLECETAELNKETDQLKEVNQGLRQEIKGNPLTNDSSKHRSSKTKSFSESVNRLRLEVKQGSSFQTDKSSRSSRRSHIKKQTSRSSEQSPPDICMSLSSSSDEDEPESGKKSYPSSSSSSSSKKGSRHYRSSNTVTTASLSSGSATSSSQMSGTSSRSSSRSKSRSKNRSSSRSGSPLSSSNRKRPPLPSRRAPSPLHTHRGGTASLSVGC